MINIEVLIGNNKIIMKNLLKFMNDFQDGYNISYILLLVKYIPLLIITHDWRFIDNHGIYPVLGKFTFTGYLRRDSNNYIVNIISYVFFLLNIFVFFLFFVSFKKLKNSSFDLKTWNKIFSKTLHILIVLNLFCSQFYYEIIFYILNKDFGSYDAINNNLTVSPLFKSMSLILGVSTLILCLILNYIFSIIIFRPYFVKKTYFTCPINKSNFNSFVYPLIKILIVQEFFLDFKSVLIAKIILRCLFIYNFLDILYSRHLKIFYVELFISSFCFVSCIFEFLFIKDFLNITDINIFDKDPTQFSYLYTSKYIFLKIILQIIFSLLICGVNSIYQKYFLVDFFENINKEKFYYFYMKSYELLRQNQTDELDTGLLSDICKSIFAHIDKCNNLDCICEKFKEIQNKKKEFDKEVFFKNLIKILKKNIKINLKKTKYSSSENYTKYLIIDTVYHLHFKKHFAKCFFNLEKIQAQQYCKKNFIINMQIFFLKYEVIKDFILSNKNSNIKTFKIMRQNYEKYNSYKNVESSCLKILEEYKKLVTLFFVKNISFDEYYIYLKYLYDSIKGGENLIKHILKSYKSHNSYYMLKIDYISCFLHSKNIHIPKNKLDDYLSDKNLDISEKMIIKHTNNKEFIIEYVSSNLAEHLEFKTNDLLGCDIHKFMSTQFVEFHYSHIVGHLKDNSILIKNKEIYFIGKSGYAMNYIVDGSILLTLAGEILVYVEVHPVCVQYKRNNVSFVSCDDEGEIISINKQFNENFYIDINVINIVQPNLFKNILMINKEKCTDKKNNLVVIKFNYLKLIKNIRGIDYTKLCDFNNSMYFKYLETLNVNRYIRQEKVIVTIEILKRNLQEKFYFYDFKIFLEDPKEDVAIFRNIRRIPGFSMFVRPNFTLTGPQDSSYKNSDLKHENIIKGKVQISNLEKIKTVSTTKDKIKGVLKKIKSISLVLKNMGWNSKKAKLKTLTSEKSLKFKKNYNKLEKENAKELKLRYSFMRMIFFILFIFAIFIFMDIYSNNIFTQVNLITNIKLNLNFLKQLNYYIVNSIFALNLVNNKIQPETIKLKNLNYSMSLDNTFDYHIKDLKIRAEIFQENFYSLSSYFLQTNDYIMDNIKLYFKTRQTIYILNSDWSLGEKDMDTFEIIEMNYREIYKIIDYKIHNAIYNNSKFGYRINDTFYNIPFNYEYPTPGDKSVYLYLQNTLVGIKNTYDNFKISLDNFFDEVMDYYKIRLLIMFISISFLVMFFFIIEGFLFYINYDKVFTKYFVLYNILQYYHSDLYIKIELLDELFLDFTDINKNKYANLSENEDLIDKQLFANNLSSFVKTSKKESLYNDNIKNESKFKSVRLFDYYDEIKIKEEKKKRFELNNKKKITFEKDKIKFVNSPMNAMYNTLATRTNRQESQTENTIIETQKTKSNIEFIDKSEFDKKKKLSIKNNEKNSSKLIKLDKNKDTNNSSIVNKTDASLIKHEDAEEKTEFEELNENKSLKKSKSFYTSTAIFWIMLIIILILIILNFINSSSRFDSVKKFGIYSDKFFKRISLFSEALMIYQFSVFQNNSTYIIQKSDVYINKIYSDFKANELEINILLNTQDKLLNDLIQFEKNLNVKDNFCKFLADSISGTTPEENLKNLNQCQILSQNAFSVGFSSAMTNLFNFIRNENNDLVNFFNINKKIDLENSIKFLNDFYYIFSFVNEDRIIFDLNKILYKLIKEAEITIFSDLKDFNNFLFYFLYVLIIILGIYTIYKSKFLIKDNDKVITYLTKAIENSIKFYKKENSEK